MAFLPSAGEHRGLGQTRGAPGRSFSPGRHDDSRAPCIVGGHLDPGGQCFSSVASRDRLYWSDDLEWSDPGHGGEEKLVCESVSPRLSHSEGQAGEEGTGSWGVGAEGAG